jgi:hypothetical protein
MEEKYVIETVECIKCGRTFETLWDISDGMPEELYCDECIENILDTNRYIETLKWKYE